MESNKREAHAIQHCTGDGDDTVGAAPSILKHALTPPTSVDMEKRERSSSELSDIKDEEEEIVPDHYYDGGKVPVFKPVCVTLNLTIDIVICAMSTETNVSGYTSNPHTILFRP